ncbi:MAG: flagellar biosynthesis protein FlhF [Chlorobiaceae bacterium]|nr:flagellar biosynthesis protein FlhF [Chlorobiaceae bacterium]
MQIKKYLAPTLKEATEKMKSELGKEAVILSTRVIPADSELGKGRMFEILAGVEHDYDKSNKDEKESNIETSIKKKDFAKELELLTQKIYTSQKTDNVVSEKKTQSFFSKSELEEKLKNVVEILVSREVQKSYIVKIVEQLKKTHGFINTNNFDENVISVIASMIKTDAFGVNKKDKVKTIALVGPTGVGKTTCIAKLAIISKIIHKLDVGLISIDTYRLGAIDQLRIFSEISKIEMHVAYEADEIQKLMNKMKKKDLIFIDTAGRSQNNMNQLKETKKYLTEANVNETILVLNSSSSTRTLYDTAEKFKIFNYSSFTFSKIDETPAHGNILNVINKFDLPVKFLTNGQTIPDDILAADSEFIAKIIYTGNYQ